MIRIRRAAAALVAATLLDFAGVTLAQVAPGAAAVDPRRPKVCLVLSGGGARGAAHIGVLRVLEEHRVPIDCITGTSMGALIGAGYASGMTLPELEALADRISVDALFKETPPRAERSIRRKQDDQRNLFSPQIGITDDPRVLLPKGVVSGVQLETVLRKISRIKGHVEFDELPIPFRAVATDLVTGKARDFDRGDLALVMRASMSVPGVIAPAEFDGMLLVDGGLVNNLPVNLARKMGADIVIAVNLGTPLMKREDIKDVLGITSQMIGILTEQNVQATIATLKETDILIEPELGGFSAGDFDQLEKTFPIGEAAARKVVARLAALSLPPELYAAQQARRTAPLAADTRVIDEIRFDPMKRVNPLYAGSLIDTQPGQPLDQAKLDADLLRLYGSDDFEHVNYRIIDSPTRRILNIEAVEKTWGPNYFRFGLGLSSDFSGSAYFNVLGQYRRTWLNPLGGEWRSDVSLGRNPSLESELYQPLEPRHTWFVAPRIEAERHYLEVYNGRDRIAQYSFPTFLTGLDVGAQASRYGEVRAGLFGGITRANLDSGTAALGPGSPSTKLVGVRLRGYIDQLDSVNFPKRGYAAEVTLIKGLTALGSESGYDRWDATAVFAHTVGAHTLQAGFRGSGPVSGDLGPTYIAEPWGGFLQQSGFKSGQLVNERFIFARLAYVHKLWHLPLFEGVYAGVSAEAGDYGRPLVAGNPSGLIYSGSAFLALDSPLGPIYLGYGLGSNGNKAAYFFLGQP